MTDSTPIERAATTNLTIGSHVVGPLAEPFIIAEMSGNHDGSLDKALDIVGRGGRGRRARRQAADLHRRHHHHRRRRP